MPTSAPYAYAAGGAMLPDGRLAMVGGSGQSSAVENLRFSGVAVGSSGRASPPWLRPVGASYSYANAAAAPPDGRGILAAGVATERSGHPGMALIRTSAEGAPDTSWDGDGIAIVRARDGSVATDVVLEPSGRAIAAGHSSSGQNHAFMLSRFDAAGGLDASFGGLGVVLTDFPGAAVARATAMARQADGKLVVAGIACAGGRGPQCGGGTARLALARYLGGDAPPPGPPGVIGTPPGTQPPSRSAPFVGLPARLRARKGRVRVRVRCLQARRCRGKLSLRRLRARRSSLLLGSRTVSVPARRSRTYSVKVRRARMGRARRLRVRIVFSGRDAAGELRRVTRTVTLRRG